MCLLTVSSTLNVKCYALSGAMHVYHVHCTWTTCVEHKCCTILVHILGNDHTHLSVRIEVNSSTGGGWYSWSLGALQVPRFDTSALQLPRYCRPCDNCQAMQAMHKYTRVQGSLQGFAAELPGYLRYA